MAGLTHPTMHPLIALCRPHQWMKNAFVLVGAVFGHHWSDPQAGQALLAFVAFCLGASAVYVFNDMRDMEADRMHPTKRLRPLAAGTVQMDTARRLAAVLALLALALAWLSSPGNLLLLGGYLVLNLAYSLKLKQMVIVDVFAIAAGFQLRVLAGTLGIGIPPSSWLLLCTLMLTLFLGFSKRRAEIDATADGPLPVSRVVLESYSVTLLDQLTAITATCSILTYALYTVSEETIAVHGSHALVYTVPLIAFGMFRYLHLLHVRSSTAQDTALAVLRDRPLGLTVIAWLVTSAVILA